MDTGTTSALGKVQAGKGGRITVKKALDDADVGLDKVSPSM